MTKAVRKAAPDTLRRIERCLLALAETELNALEAEVADGRPRRVDTVRVLRV